MNEVPSWLVDTQLDINKRDRSEDDEDRHWQLKAQAQFFMVSATQGAGAHFQWSSSDPRIPMGNPAPAAKGKIDLVFKAQRKARNAHEQGGALECTLRGEVAYAGMILAMPGQQARPVGGAKPLLPGSISCRGSGEYQEQNQQELSELPLRCDEQAPLQYSNGRLSQSAQCEVDGYTVSYRFTASPAPLPKR